MRLFKKRFADAGDPPVWMHPIELSQIRAVFEAVQPRRVLEWGTGGSTRYLLENGPYIERFVSIEHHPGWVEKVRAAVRDPRLTLHHVAADIPPPDINAPISKQVPWIEKAEIDPAIMATYAAFPRSLGERFDLAFVDGRGRIFCMPVAWELLEPGGVMIVHDAQRAVYRPTMAALGRATFLEPYHSGQVAVMKKPRA
ncbi:MAG: class I SAM-dependent methyltransferase [Myxococcota bacterium]